MGTYSGKVGSSGVTLRNKAKSIGITVPKGEHPTNIHFELQSGGACWKNSSASDVSLQIYLYSDTSGTKKVKVGTVKLTKKSSNITKTDFSISGDTLKGCKLYLYIKASGTAGLRNKCTIKVTTSDGDASEDEDPNATVLDISHIKYSVVAVLTTGKEVYLNDNAINVAWEENESELACRLNLTVRDVPLTSETGAKKKKNRLAQTLALCTAIYVYCDYGQGEKEVFRGTIWEWSHSQIHDDEIIITAYDPLFYLQKSDDYGFWAAGKTTKAICKEVLKKWGVSLKKFNAPSVKHDKLALKTKKISAILTTVLDEAKLRTGANYVIRYTKGKVEILGMGQNKTIWTFAADKNVMSVSDKYSMTNLVTKVVILGKEEKDSEKMPPIEATEYGKKEYGILQKIINVGSKELEEAEKEAKNILKKDGKPERRMTLTSADFPAIRKGDRIRVITDNVNGYFFVLTVSHNASTQQMQMEVEPQDE